MRNLDKPDQYEEIEPNYYVIQFGADVDPEAIPMPKPEWEWQTEIIRLEDGRFELRVKYEESIINDMRNQIYFREVKQHQS